jgi:hypothetical protein
MQRCNLQQLKTQLSTHQSIHHREKADRWQQPTGVSRPQEPRPHTRRDGERVLYVMEHGPATEPEQPCGSILPWSSAPGPGGPARRPNRRIGLALGAAEGYMHKRELSISDAMSLHYYDVYIDTTALPRGRHYRTRQ